MTPFSLFLVALFVLVVHGVDLDPKKFTSEVLGDERAWMVEFYSSMCGGCQEFASTWDRIADAFSESSSGGAIKSGKVNIDNSEGMKLAEKLGVLEDGVPHVKLFKSKGDTKGISVVKSKLPTHFQVLAVYLTSI